MPPQIPVPNLPEGAHQGKSIKWILSILVLIALFGVGYWIYASETFGPIACTAEAKICPDGTSVGRSGPNCEFAPCPTEKQNQISDWKTYKNTQYGFEFKYPMNLAFGGEGTSSSGGKYMFFSNPSVLDRGEITITVEKGKTVADLKNKLENVKETGTVNVDNVLARKFSTDNPSNSLTYILFEQGSYVFQITFEPVQISNIDNILSTFKFIPLTSQVGEKDRICLQKPTTAKNPSTGESRDFPDSCIPEGWVVCPTEGCYSVEINN